MEIKMATTPVRQCVHTFAVYFTGTPTSIIGKLVDDEFETIYEEAVLSCNLPGGKELNNENPRAKLCTYRHNFRILQSLIYLRYKTLF
jgi:hypothetical protein